MSFSLNKGGALCEKCVPHVPGCMSLTNGTWELMKKLLEWEYSRLTVLHPAPNNEIELQRVMRRYLDFRLEYPLKSLDFLQTLEGLNP
jgi:recombinational DNA repair protein (RecF pathway)